VASQDLECHQIDIQNAFVQSDLQEQIYMQQPPGYEDGTSQVLQLNKSLYGLKQAPRVWQQTLTTYLFELGCVQSQSDGALFTFRDDGGSPVYFLLYVDDIQMRPSSSPELQVSKDFSWQNFQAKVWEGLNSFCRCQFSVTGHAELLS
jgi:histone deacetylase 1/2